MCTAAAYKTKGFYFGRTLDHDFSYGDEIVIIPRSFSLEFRSTDVIKKHYAMIGMACAAYDYPLYYDAVNEKGLCIAGLNFAGNADYKDPVSGKDNIAQFEFIPWILSRCASVQEAEKLINDLNLTNTQFRPELPPARLHWLIADKNKAITVESVKDGIKVYPNPVGVLTNDPTFPEQMFNLNRYMGLSPRPPKNTFAPGLELNVYSRGMGGLGLPGDLSSQSRFVRAAFVKMNSVSGESEAESVSQFFHILNSVDQQRGCCDLGDGKYETTIYTSCCSAHKGIYYYTTYGNHQITAVDMYREDLDAAIPIRYKPITSEQIKYQNKT